MEVVDGALLSGRRGVASGTRLVEVGELASLLQERFNLPDSELFVGGGMGGGGGDAAEEAAPVEEKTHFDVKLASFDAKAKIKIIKEVRGMTDLGLKEAKALVESAPVVIKENLSKAEAEELVAKLTELGAELELE